MNWYPVAETIPDDEPMLGFWPIGEYGFMVAMVHFEHEEDAWYAQMPDGPEAVRCSPTHIKSLGRLPS